MSLRVWLPLTDGTLKQQGLDSAEATISGTVNLTNAGKLGKCATFSTAGGGVTLPATTMQSFTECSVAFWIKLTSWNASYATFFQAGLGGTPWNNYIFGILRNGTNSNLCFTLTNSNGSSTSASYTSSNLEVGQWYHLAFTYKAGTVCIYKDGALDKTYSTTYVPNFAGITHISIGRGTNNSSYQTNCEMNDVRIYDHALSLMEVKQLSQGLVLHYPLNRQGFGQENLIRDTQGVFVSGLGSADGSGAEFRSRTLGCSLPIETGKTYTLSFDLKMVLNTPSNSPYFLVYNTNYKGPHGKWIWQPCSSMLAGNYSAGDIIEKKIVIHLTPTSFEAGSYTNDNIEFYSNYGTSNWFEVSNLKLEEGDIATPWAPNSADEIATTMSLNSNIEYDTSGYCNNGTRYGTFNFNSETPKYAVSTQYNGTDNTLSIPFNASIWPDNFTMSIWFRKDELGSKSYETLFGGPSGFEMDTRSGSSASLSIYMASTRGGNVYTGIEFGKWYMVTLVNDGTHELYYVNGELVKTIDKKSMPVGNYWIGSWNSATGQNYKGLLSDARIYATALSADDVLSLYQNCATIDPDGTIRGQIR